MIDRTEHDEQAARRTARDTVDEDAHADHSLDPNEHYGQESAVTAETERYREADAAGDR